MAPPWTFVGEKSVSFILLNTHPLVLENQSIGLCTVESSEWPRYCSPSSTIYFMCSLGNVFVWWMVLLKRERRNNYQGDIIYSLMEWMIWMMLECFFFFVDSQQRLVSHLQGSRGTAWVFFTRLLLFQIFTAAWVDWSDCSDGLKLDLEVKHLGLDLRYYDSNDLPVITLYTV